MIIGVPKEIKTNENRVALVPAGAEALVGGGPHRAHRARAPGIGSGFADADYVAVGAHDHAPTRRRRVASGRA